MNSPIDSKKVQQFISDMHTVNANHGEIVVLLYKLFETNNSSFTDKIIYGGIGIFLDGELIGGIYPSKKHVSLVFSDGYKLQDPLKILEGSGKFRRHIKIRNLAEVESKYCEEYIKKFFELYC